MSIRPVRSACRARPLGRDSCDPRFTVPSGPSGTRTWSAAPAASPPAPRAPAAGTRRGPSPEPAGPTGRTATAVTPPWRSTAVAHRFGTSTLPACAAGDAPEVLVVSGPQDVRSGVGARPAGRRQAAHLGSRTRAASNKRPSSNQVPASPPTLTTIHSLAMFG